jgi:DNA-binding response OmpR family regulator
VLIVDDEPRIVSVIARGLTMYGFDIDVAHDSGRALDLFTPGTYDLVVLDLLLEPVDGFTVLERFREAQPDQDVLILSALMDVESKVRCFELGASDYVTKPFALAELIARACTRVRESQSHKAGRYLRRGSLSLDLHRHVVLADGRRIDLSTREFMLLEHLMRKPGDVCTRQELLEAVWGYSFDPGTNVVDVYIRRLRTKLGRDVIETIRNVGYSYGAAA